MVEDNSEIFQWLDLWSYSKNLFHDSFQESEESEESSLSKVLVVWDWINRSILVGKERWCNPLIPTKIEEVNETPIVPFNKICSALLLI